MTRNTPVCPRPSSASLFLLGVLFAACGGGGGSSGAAPAPSLTVLAFAGATLQPAFSPDTQAYTASVTSAVDVVTLSASTAGGAQVAVNDEVIGTGSVSRQLSLAEGTNVFAITLTQGGAAGPRTYTVTIERAPVPALDGLSLAVGTLDPPFDPDTLFYAGNVGFLASATTLTPTTGVLGASIAINGLPVVTGSSSQSFPVSQVPTTVTVQVSTLQGESRIYVVNLARQAASAFAEEVYAKASNTDNTDNFGFSIAVSGDIMAVGAIREDSSSTGVDSTPDENAFEAGAVYVFARTGTTWAQEAYLKAEQCTESDWFGWDVAVSGDTVAVGVPREDSSTTGIGSVPNELAVAAGAVYVFRREGTTWQQEAYIKASNTESGDGFGGSVAIDGDTLVVGAAGEDSDAFAFDGTATGNPNASAEDSGALYVFERSGTSWSQTAFLKAANAGVGDSLGGVLNVAISGDTIAAGAPAEDSSTTGINSVPNEGASGSGAVYVFVRNGAMWTQQAYVKASNTGNGDGFGFALDLDGDRLVVGANGEDSSSSGVNSTPNDNLSNSGAAYVYERFGATWLQLAYLKAANPGQDDGFGVNVAVAADCVAVCSPGEDGSTSGVNGAYDDGAQDAGAVYVFDRPGTTWSQRFYVKASNSQASGGFASRVAASGDTIVVGAFGEDSATTGVGNPPAGEANSSGAAYVFR